MAPGRALHRGPRAGPAAALGGLRGVLRAHDRREAALDAGGPGGPRRVQGPQGAQGGTAPALAADRWTAVAPVAHQYLRPAAARAARAPRAAVEPYRRAAVPGPQLDLPRVRAPRP